MKIIFGKLAAAFAIVAVIVSFGLMPASAADQLPFKARASGSFTFVDESHLSLAGQGNASFLGRSTSNGSIAFLGPASCEGGFKIHDDERLTSNDTGEQITMTVDGEACPTALPGVYQINAAYAVTGGTGRFAGATGQGTAVCTGDFNTNTFSFTMSGTVSRPNPA